MTFCSPSNGSLPLTEAATRVMFQFGWPLPSDPPAGVGILLMRHEMRMTLTKKQSPPHDEYAENGTKKKKTMTKLN
jgi:hypothetical protein